MFKEVSDFLIETTQPVNKNALLMQVYKVPKEIIDYLSFNSLRESKMNKIEESDILRYRLIHNNDTQYIFMILKDECFKKECKVQIEHTVFSGCLTIIVMIREYYTNPALVNILPFKDNPLLPIIDTIIEGVICTIEPYVEHFLNSIRDIPNTKAILAVVTNAVPVITISHLLYVFKNVVSKEVIANYLSDPNRKYFKCILNLDKETIDKYILYCSDLSVDYLLDNAMISGDLTLVDAYTKVLGNIYNEQK